MTAAPRAQLCFRSAHEPISAEATEELVSDAAASEQAASSAVPCDALGSRYWRLAAELVAKEWARDMLASGKTQASLRGLRDVVELPVRLTCSAMGAAAGIQS